MKSVIALGSQCLAEMACTCSLKGLIILNSMRESVERPGVVVSRCLLADFGYSINLGQPRDRSMRLGIIGLCETHSHHQNGEVQAGTGLTKREMADWLADKADSLR